MQPTGPQEVSSFPARGLLRVLASLLQITGVVLLFAPGLLAEVARYAGVELEMADWQVRAIAAFALITAIALGIALRSGTRTNLESALQDLAIQTGGTCSKERPRANGPNISGGPTVRWEMQGIPVTLSCVRSGRGKASTSCTAILRPARPFQFVAMPRNAFTKALSSSAVWGFVLKAAKHQGDSGDSGGADRRAAVDRMAFLAAPEVTLDHPDLQRMLILKSDDPGRAVAFLAHLHDPLLRYRESCGIWQMSLLRGDHAGNHALLVSAPGVRTKAESLRAIHDLARAALAALAEGGDLKPGSIDSNAAA